MKDCINLNHEGGTGGAGAGAGEGSRGHSIPLPTTMPPELAPTARLLDGLGEFDRASGPAGMESRVLRMVREQAGEGAMQSEEVVYAGEQLGALAQADRAAASGSLEDRIFMATRRILTHNAEMNSEEREAARPTFKLGHGLVRMAAAILLGGSVIWVYQAMTPSKKFQITPPVEITNASLEKKLDEQLDNLGYVFTLAMVGTESDVSPVSPSTSESEPLEEWFQFDFVEGSGSL